MGLHRECEIFANLCFPSFEALMQRSPLSSGSPSDGEVEEEVHHGDDDERHQQHHDRVGREDVVPGVAVVGPHLGRTYLRTCDYEIFCKAIFCNQQPASSASSEDGYMVHVSCTSVLCKYLNMFGTLQLHKKTSAIRYSKNIFCFALLSDS